MGGRRVDESVDEEWMKGAELGGHVNPWMPVCGAEAPPSPSLVDTVQLGAIGLFRGTLPVAGLLRGPTCTCGSLAL